MVDYTSRNLGLDTTGKDPSVTTDEVGRVTVLDVVGRNNYPGHSVLRSSPTAVMTCASVRGVGVLVALYTDTTVIWDGTPCSLAEMYPRFGRACRFRLQERTVSQPLPMAHSQPCFFLTFPYIYVTVYLYSYTPKMYTLNSPKHWYLSKKQWRYTTNTVIITLDTVHNSYLQHFSILLTLNYTHIRLD